MDFRTLDTQSAYRALIASQDADERHRIFCDQLAAPFAGLGQRMGMPDPIAAFKQWGMTAEMYADQREYWSATLDALTSADAWQRAADSLARAKSAFAPHLDRIGLGEI